MTTPKTPKECRNYLPPVGSMNACGKNGELCHSCKKELPYKTYEDPSLIEQKTPLNKKKQVIFEYKKNESVKIKAGYYPHKDIAQALKDLKEDDLDEEEKRIKEAQSMVIANMSLTRPLNIDDIKYAVNVGFDWGKVDQKKKENKIFGSFE